VVRLYHWCSVFTQTLPRGGTDLIPSRASLNNTIAEHYPTDGGVPTVRVGLIEIKRSIKPHQMFSDISRGFVDRFLFFATTRTACYESEIKTLRDCRARMVYRGATAVICSLHSRQARDEGGSAGCSTQRMSRSKTYPQIT